MGGQSFECQMCHKWFLSRGALWNHTKALHKESEKLFPNNGERAAYDRGFARGWYGAPMEPKPDFPQPYAKGYWEGVYVADPAGAKE
jgi:hypothetical protein